MQLHLRIKEDTELKKFYKYLVVPVLILCFAFNCLSTVAVADGGGANATITSPTGSTGKTVKVALSLDGLAKADTIGVNWTFASDKLTFVSGNWLLDNEKLSDIDSGNNRAVWTSEGLSDVNKKVLELSFKIDDNVSVGTSIPINFNVIVKNGSETLSENSDLTSTVSVVNGVIISGDYTCYGDVNDVTTIEVLKDGVLVANANVETGTKDTNGKITGEFATNPIRVEDGQYTIRVKKTKHCPREYNVDLGSGDITKNVDILLYGDVDQNGKIQTSDALQIQRKSLKKSSKLDVEDDELAGYLLKVGDITGDGKLQTNDALQIQRKALKKSSKIDDLS